MVDIHAIEKKWAKRWQDEKIFESHVDHKKPKFFVTFPYPYVNSILHIGHLYTLMRVEGFARYKRMQGFNVLFAQGWHATGSPIVSAAERVKEKEPKQLKLLKEVGITEGELPKFEDPAYWITYFVPEAIKDYKAMGMSVDWRRQFHTTELNPHYDAFIRWQFNKLKEKKYVVKGKFPVVWCLKCNGAVSDHSRSVGEGETVQEFCLVKHKLKENTYVVTATLRQDTILGITNLYLHPNVTYHEIKVNGKEHWIVGEPIIDRLTHQEYTVENIGTIKGTELIGKHVEVFGKRKVLILPATFVSAEFGSGIVHSVPSDSADDLIALWDLQKDEATLKKYHLPLEEVRAIEPIPVLKMPGYSDVPAKDFLIKFNVKSQNERQKLDEIKKELYKLSHHSATFNERYRSVFSKNLEGVSVEEGKDFIKGELLAKGAISLYYQLTGPVVCRCLTPSIVKIVDDQWFIAYGDETWKESVHEAFKDIKLYPEKSREQFNYVIDWLHNWACTRESGLGTRLPWDEKWLIESLSDSTIYMAYYTIAHLVKDLDPKLLDDNFFDYVFLKKEVQVKVDKKIAQAMREEFEYWYPVDFRNSGKDLIQNHLTFYVFNHTAIFPKDKWPKGIGVNGWITVDGEKMSKSKGNIIPLREMPERFSVDCARFTILSGGEDMDDPNWDSNFATALKGKLEQFYEFCTTNYGKGRTTKEPIDAWMESKLNEVIKKTTDAMDETLFRSALQSAYFELTNAIKWYHRRCKGNYHKEIMTKTIEAQVLMLCPVIPFICEEIWHTLGKKGFASHAAWPKYDETKVNTDLDSGEELIRTTLEDIHAVLKLAKVEKPTELTMFVSEPWKYELYRMLVATLAKTRNPGEVLKEVMNIPTFKAHGQELSKLVPRLVQGGKIPRAITSEEIEYKTLEDAVAFFKEEFGCTMHVIRAEQSKEPKAKQALPGKVALIVK